MKNALLLMSTLLTVDARVSVAAAKPDAAIAIRTYNYGALSAEYFAAAKKETEQIFRRAGISIDWIACRVPGDPAGMACTEPMLAGRDLMLRLLDRVPADGDHIVALGESMLDREQRGGVLMTVDLFPVRTVAERASMAMPTLLGRAIAHEIGHLLLRSGEHPRMGLMRALWSHDELRGLKPAHWGFSAREAAQMRETVHQLSKVAD